MNFLWDVLLGLAAGFIAKLILPGGNFEPKGCVTMALLGMFGGALGGFVFNILGISKGNDLIIHLLGALVGSLLLLLIGRFITGNNNRTPAA